MSTPTDAQIYANVSRPEYLVEGKPCLLYTSDAADE